MQCRKSSRATLVLKSGRHGPSQYILFIFIQHAERREDMRSSHIWATRLDVSRTKSYHCFQPSWPNCPSASSNTSVKTTSVTSFAAFCLSHFFYFFHFFHHVTIFIEGGMIFIEEVKELKDVQTTNICNKKPIPSC